MNENMMEYSEKEKHDRLKKEKGIYSEFQERESELAKYRDILRTRERELEEYENHLKAEQLEREKYFRKELSERDQLIESREKELYARQKEMEKHFSRRFEETEELRESLQKELLQKESELKNLLVETEREKERYREESRKSIESKSQKFVDSALQLLGKKESKFHDISKNWAILGACSIISAICFAIYTMISSADLFHQTSNSSLSYYLYSLFRGLIVVSLFGALSRYAFVLSNSFMHESLKSGERLHAIKFGEFYLDAYGADAEWEQLKEAFENWNISGSSAFSRKDMEAKDNGLVDTITESFEKVAKMATEKSSK
ncbi:hypothetical protein [Pseudoalteromonas distincta]|uniref:hypothetical protein n=1 Tax=Pseudoalteromonas distincta TaxID=77608 RepID=UPI0011F1A32F|nr:hypothetical protein [Pseudoalteromonas distincta]KAA1156772.1 hypothetical protein EU511_16330 [Pseudoalteromonas distincta]